MKIRIINTGAQLDPQSYEFRAAFGCRFFTKLVFETFKSTVYRFTTNLIPVEYSTRNSIEISVG